MAAAAAVVAVAADGSFIGFVGDLGLVTDMGDETLSFLTPLVVGLVCVSVGFCNGFGESFLIASLASLDLFADSITPLIFAGPPLIIDASGLGFAGDVGVFAADFSVGVFGEAFSSIGAFAESVGGLTKGLGFGVLLVFASELVATFVGGVGADFSFDCIFLIISAALEPTPLGLASVLSGFAGSEGFLGVPSKAEPFSMDPNPPSMESFEVWGEVGDMA